MRLLHTTDLKLKYFEGVDIPEYAILSHRWSSEEVSYQDLLEGSGTKKSGYRKIFELCRLAKSRGLDWAWIDTCCIDKSSSAELTENINSMWSYYHDAVECYAYLADVADEHKGLNKHHFVATLDLSDWFAALHRSEWFTRGWTLQELIAPMHLYFCTSDWAVIGSKADFAKDLSLITKIGDEYLQNPDSVSKASVAMRMSWAAERSTTRIEDIAYSLLGLFDVSMPLLYGEGTKAFMRLQKKIIKKSDDESIFAWQGNFGPSGMLARSPANFANSNNIVQLDIPHTERLQYQLTNKGLELKIPIVMHDSHVSNNRRARSKSPNDDQSRFNSRGPSKYIPSEIRVPNGRQWKSVQLACGFPEGSQDSEEKTAPSTARAVWILLKHTSSGWQRVKCDRFELSSDFAPKNDLLRVLYHVPQEGL